MSAISLPELAKLVSGRPVGDPQVVIHGASTIHRAQNGEITLADSPKLAAQIATCTASAVVVPPDFPDTDIPRIVVSDVHRAFSTIVAHFHPPRKRTSIGISPAAHIAPSAVIGDNVEIHPLATVGEDVEIGPGTVIHSGAHVMAGCRIGENVVLFPGAVLYEDTVIGPRSTVHSGCIIGGYGFGYQTTDGHHKRCAQLGIVEIGADVEIGANSTVDRGTYSSTTIGDGTKIDNLVMIAHNCQIGKHNLICSQVGVAGSCTTGDYVVMAGQVGLSDHLNIGDRARLGAQAGLMNDVPADGAVVGSPATAERDQWRMWGLMRQLPDLKRQLRTIRKQVEGLLPSKKSDDRQDAA